RGKPWSFSRRSVTVGRCSIQLSYKRFSPSLCEEGWRYLRLLPAGARPALPPRPTEPAGSSQGREILPGLAILPESWTATVAPIAWPSSATDFLFRNAGRLTPAGSRERV